MSPPEPFPWSALDRFSSAQARALSRARRQIAPHLPLAALADGCARLLGRPLALEVVETWADEQPPHAPAHLGVPLALDGGAAALLLYVENALALRLASLVLGHPLAWPDPARALAPEVAGAASAFLALAARQTGAPFRLGPATAPEGPFACVRAVVLVGEDVFDAMAAVPLDPVPPPPPPFDRHALAALGDLPLALPLVAAAGGASDDDLAALAPGAAWAPGDAWALRRGPDGAWHGGAMLAAPRAEAGLEVRGDEGGLRLGGKQIACPWEVFSNDEAPPGPALRVVRVEVGRVTLPARAWATLAPGAALPPPPPGPVTLRVGGEAVARGRLARVGGEDVVIIDETAPGP